MRKYVSPEAIKVNFGVNDICATSGMLQNRPWSTSGWADDGVMSISWRALIGQSSDEQ